MGAVMMPERLLKKIERTLDELAGQKEEYLSEVEAAKFLGISNKTMKNYVANGKIKPSMYVFDALENRRYPKSKLINNA